MTRRAPLVGRLAERSVLEHAYEEAAAGRTTCVYLRGPSGAGKTALGQRFLADLDQAGEAVVLSGRCYEHESVPFKAFDSVIDALTDHLLEHPPAELGPLLGAHCGELARLFPVLGRVPAVKEAAQAHTQRLAAASAGGEHESRRRAFAALKRLLYGLAVRRPLVVAIDDLHWSDVDSVRLVSELLAPPDAPPLLLLAAYRSDWPGSALALQELDRVQLRVAPDQNVYRVELGPLAPDDAEALARALLQAAGLATEPWAATIAGESGGNSFLISAIVRHLSHQSGELGGAPLAAGVGLEGLLAARVARLEPGARGLLELVAVAGQPVPADLLAAAQGRPARLDAWLAELHGERLIFLGQRGHERSVECAHDRLREVVVAGLAADARLALHRRLAETAVDLGRDDPEFLARHLHAAGEHAAAASHAVRAAQAAAAALAFDRAADLYLLALRGEPDSWALMCACAEAKVNAGRGAEAAPLYAQASALAPASETHRLRQKACEQYFVVGETERALAVLRALLVDLGIDYPDASDALHRQFLAMVGALARDEPGPPLGPAPLSSRVAVDTLWSATKGFLIHSPVRGAYFAVASALMARELGDEGRVVRGLCILPGVLAREQEPSLFAALEARVERHLAATEDSYLVGLSAIMTAVAASFGHDWGAALHGLEFGGQHLRSHCAGVSWECNFGMLMLMNLLETRGELRSIAHRSAVLGQQAKETGNAMMEFVAAYYSALTLIAADAIPQARDQVRRVAQISEELPSAHLRALMIEVDCDLYVGDVAAAWDRIERAWGYYEQRWVLYARGQRINASGLRGQVALARARQCAGDERAALVAIADGERRNLEAAGTPQARAIAALLRAMAAAANGRSVGAVVHRLHTAVAAFELADMALHAACVTHRLGAWSGGEAGAEMVARSEAFMRLQTVARPLRWVAMVTPCMAPQP